MALSLSLQTLRPSKPPKTHLKPTQNHHPTQPKPLHLFLNHFKPRPKPISAFGFLGVLDAGTGSVQHWTCFAPASNVPGDAAAAPPPSAHLPSTPLPVQHLLAIPSPLPAIHYLPRPSYYPAKPSSPPRRDLRSPPRSLTSATSSCHHRDFLALLTSPMPPPDMPHGPSTLTGLCHTCQPPLPHLQNPCNPTLEPMHP